jgi:ADP-ribose pyrophosphatase YjhB (NUDIX family)
VSKSISSSSLSDRHWYPDVWDLPGGHVEPGETCLGALARKIREELGVFVHESSTVPLERASTAEFEMRIWLVARWRRTPTNLASNEHDAIGWFTVEQLEHLELAYESYPETLRTAVGA